MEGWRRLSAVCTEHLCPYGSVHQEAVVAALIAAVMRSDQDPSVCSHAAAALEVCPRA